MSSMSFKQYGVGVLDPLNSKLPIDVFVELGALRGE